MYGSVENAGTMRLYPCGGECAQIVCMDCCATNSNAIHFLNDDDVGFLVVG